MNTLSWYYTPGALVILGITLAFSIIGLTNENFKQQCMLHPYSIVKNKKLYTMFTSGLVHADFSHLLFNMLTYYFFAFQLEKIFLHTEHFIMLYIAGLLLCDVPTIYRQRNNPGYYSLGASGAISAILFCMIVFEPTMGIRFLFIPVSIPAYVFGFLYLLYTTYASNRQLGNINHDAHLYGALTGIVMAFLLNPQEAAHVMDKVLHRDGY